MDPVKISTIRIQRIVTGQDIIGLLMAPPSRVYCGMNYTGSSCKDIYNNNPEIGDKPGYYHDHFYDNQWTYCNMTAITTSFISTCAGVGGELLILTLVKMIVQVSGGRQHTLVLASVEWPVMIVIIIMVHVLLRDQPINASSIILSIIGS